MKPAPRKNGWAVIYDPTNGVVRLGYLISTHETCIAAEQAERRAKSKAPSLHIAARQRLDDEVAASQRVAP